MRQAFDRENDLFRRDMAGAWFAGYVFGLLSALAIMLACGCATKPVLPTVPGAVPVSIVSWPAPIQPECEIAELTQIPDVFVWTQITDEQAQRVYITQRQLADLVVWFKDLRLWTELTNSCLRKLVKP